MPRPLLYVLGRLQPHAVLVDCRTRRHSHVRTTLINPERTDVCYITLALYTSQ